MLSELNFKSNKFIAALTIVFALVALPTFINIASYLETQFYPVVTEFKINSEIPTVMGHTIIAGEFVKKRECVSRGITWYMQDKKTGQEIPLPVNRMIVPPNRPTGEYKFGPWEIWANKDDLRDRGYAVVLHDCHSLYLTRSIVYAKGQFR